MPVLLQEATTVIPGQGGVRAPLDRFVRPDGMWGYAIPGKPGGHCVNFIGFPSVLDPRESVAGACSDMRNLMETHHLRNTEDLADAGHDGYRCWSDLWGRHKGETLVIASCGPSLTRSLPTLYRHRDKFRLMCLNRSHRAFMHPGHRPDYYYFVERRAMPDWGNEVENRTGRILEPLDLSGITMIGTPQCDYRMVRRFDADKRYWGWTSLGGLGDYADVARLKSFDVKGGTTIGNAPLIAMRLGFRRIILVGCDFGCDVVAEVSRDGKQSRPMPTRLYFDRMWNCTHHTGINDQERAQWLQNQSALIGIDGRAVSTNPDWVCHRNYLLAILDIVQYEGGMECVNATPRGILNWNTRDLETVLCE